jgi:hypothetical protein
LGTFLLAEENSEQFSQKNRFELSDGGKIVGGGVQKTVEYIGRIQFRPDKHKHAPARFLQKVRMAVSLGQSSNIF